MPEGNSYGTMPVALLDCWMSDPDCCWQALFCGILAGQRLELADLAWCNCNFWLHCWIWRKQQTGREQRNRLSGLLRIPDYWCRLLIAFLTEALVTHDSVVIYDCWLWKTESVGRDASTLVISKCYCSLPTVAPAIHCQKLLVFIVIFVLVLVN